MICRCLILIVLLVLTLGSTEGAPQGIEDQDLHAAAAALDAHLESMNSHMALMDAAADRGASEAEKAELSNRITAAAAAYAALKDGLDHFSQQVEGQATGSKDWSDAVHQAQQVVEGHLHHLVQRIHSEVTEDSVYTWKSQAFQSEQAAQPTGSAADLEGTCLGAWPLFHNAEALKRSHWGKYFIRIYGEIPQKGYPICLGEFSQFYDEEIKKANVTLPESQQGCPASPSDPPHWQHEGLFNPVDQDLKVQHFAKAPVPAHKWVEVKHRGISRKDPKELHGAWFLAGTGTGFWVNMGRTIIFTKHREAYDFFGISGTLYTGAPENKMVEEAARQGFDTIQFMQDGCAGNPCCKPLGLGACCDTLEFVKTSLIGKYGCADASGGSHIGGSYVRAGWQASRPCNCDENGDRGLAFRSAHPYDPVGYMNCEGIGHRAPDLLNDDQVLPIESSELLVDPEDDV